MTLLIIVGLMGFILGGGLGVWVTRQIQTDLWTLTGMLSLKLREALAFLRAFESYEYHNMQEEIKQLGKDVHVWLRKTDGPVDGWEE